MTEGLCIKSNKELLPHHYILERDDIFSKMRKQTKQKKQPLTLERLFEQQLVLDEARNRMTGAISNKPIHAPATEKAEPLVESKRLP